MRKLFFIIGWGGLLIAKTTPSFAADVCLVKVQSRSTIVTSSIHCAGKGKEVLFSQQDSMGRIDQLELKASAIQLLLERGYRALPEGVFVKN